MIELATSLHWAIKVVEKKKLNEQEREMMRSEVAIMRLLNHPNVVQMKEVFEDRGKMNLVMELVEGGELFDRIRQKKVFSEFTAFHITRQLLETVKYLHDVGIVHRDIKPENILIKRVNSGLQAKIADFGLACFMGPNERCTESVGTLRFAAPEVLSRLPYREAADLWSVGVTLYIMLHGTMPFAGKSDEETALSVLRRKLNFRGKSWTGVSSDAVAVLSALLVRHPRGRASGKEVLASDWLRVLHN